MAAEWIEKVTGSFEGKRQRLTNAIDGVSGGKS
jgi:hypothetical protein